MLRVDPGRKYRSNRRYGRHQQARTRSQSIAGRPHLGKLTVQLSMQAVKVFRRHASIPPQMCAAAQPNRCDRGFYR